MPPVKFNDGFCWACAKEANDLKCRKCIRTFHSDCVSSCASPMTLVDWMCPVCIKLETTTKINKTDDLKALSIVVDHAISDEKFGCLKYSSDFWCMVNPMSLLMLKANIGAYSSFEEFLTDAKWIEHNSLVLDSRNKNRKVPKVASKLINYFIKEIEKIKLCSECYLNACSYPNSWSTMVCSKPHLLIWAKIAHGGIYCPAKQMSVAEQQHVNVYFFGGHGQAKVPAINCLLFSQTNPNREPITSNNQFASAMEDADLYIANIREKFGSFRYADCNDEFDPNKMEQYLRHLIPGTFATDQQMNDSGTVRSDALLEQTNGQNKEPDASMTERNGGPNLKRKFSNNLGKNGTDVSVSDAGPSEPQTKSVRTTDGAQEQPAHQTQSKNNNDESTCHIDFNPIMPQIKIDYDSDADTDVAPFESSENDTTDTNAPTNIPHNSMDTHKSLIINTLDRQISIMTEIHNQKVAAITTGCEQKIAEANNVAEAKTKQVKSELQKTLAEKRQLSNRNTSLKQEIESLKKEHEQKLNEATNALEAARTEIEILNEQNKLEKNRCEIAELEILVQEQRTADNMQKMEKKHRDKIKAIKNKLMQIIRTETSNEE